MDKEQCSSQRGRSPSEEEHCPQTMVCLTSDPRQNGTSLSLEEIPIQRSDTRDYSLYEHRSGANAELLSPTASSALQNTSAGVL